MNVPVIKGSLPDETVTILSNSIDEMKTFMPFAKTATAEVRRAIFKWGGDSESFVDKAFDGAKTRPDLISGAFGMSDFEADMALVRKLRTVSPKIDEIHSLVSDTIMLLQSQSMTKATQFYKIVKEAYENGVSGVEELYRDLQERFPGHTHPVEEEDPANPPA